MVLMKLYCHLVAEVKKAIYRIVNGIELILEEVLLFVKALI